MLLIKNIDLTLLEKNISSLIAACERHQVLELYAFGSILTNRFNKDSDLDFLVSFDEPDPFIYAEHYFDLKFELEALFNRKIDLLEAKAIRNQTFRNTIDKQKKLVYARRSQSLA